MDRSPQNAIAKWETELEFSSGGRQGIVLAANVQDSPQRGQKSCDRLLCMGGIARSSEAILQFSPGQCGKQKITGRNFEGRGKLEKNS